MSFAAAIESCLQEDPVFGRCYIYGYTYEGDAFGTLPEWDVSRVTNMKEAFYKKDGLGGNLYGNFNGNLKNWNVSSVTLMTRMFYDCSRFNQDISRWDVRNVIDMTQMFHFAKNFKGEISSWNVPSDQERVDMFIFADSFKAKWDCFDSADTPTSLSNCNEVKATWTSAKLLSDTSIRQDVKTCLDESSTGDCTGHSLGPMHTWDTSEVKDMSNLFADYEATFNADLSSWDVSSVTSMVGMFKNCVKFNSDISGWNTDSVTEMDEMFSGASSFNYSIKAWGDEKFEKL